MSRIDRLFEAHRAAGKRVLVVYLCVGDPSLEASVRLAQAALEAGVAAATARASGFVYCISVTGVTGNAGEDALAAASAQAARLRDTTRLPVVIGFGIDGPKKAQMATGRGSATPGADGIAVGTAIVKAIESENDDAARVRAVSRLVASLRAALDEV